MLDELVIRANEIGLGDLSYLSGIPGTVGGAIVGNAGAFGEQIGDVLQRAELLSYSGFRRWVSHEDLKFAYRTSALKESREVLLRAELKVAKVDKVKANERRNEILQLRKKNILIGKIEPQQVVYFEILRPHHCHRQAAGWFLEEAGAKFFGRKSLSLFKTCHYYHC